MEHSNPGSRTNTRPGAPEQVQVVTDEALRGRSLTRSFLKGPEAYGRERMGEYHVTSGKSVHRQRMQDDCGFCSSCSSNCLWIIFL